MDDVEYPPESTSPRQAKTEEWTEERMSRRDRYEMSYRVTGNCQPRQCAYGAHRHSVKAELLYRPNTTKRLAKMDGYSMQVGKQFEPF